MKIGKDWQIDSDAMNVTLKQRRRAKKKGDKPAHEYWTTVGYFATLKGAIHFLVDQKVRDTGLNDLKKVSKRVDEIHALVQGMPSEALGSATEAPEGKSGGIV